MNDRDQQNIVDLCKFLLSDEINIFNYQRSHNKQIDQISMADQKNKIFMEFDSDGQQQGKQQQILQNNQFSPSPTKGEEPLDKFSGNKIGKSFFNEQDDDYFDQTNQAQQQISSPLKEETKSALLRSQQRGKRRRTKKLDPLQPLSKAENKPQKVTVPLIGVYEKDYTPQQSHHNIFDRNEENQIEEIDISPTKKDKFTLGIKKVEENTVNLGQINSDISDNQEIIDIEQHKRNNIHPPKVQIMSEIPKENSLSQEYSPEPLRNKQGSLNMKQVLTTPLPLDKTMRMTLNRQKGIIQLHPEYNLHFTHDNRYLMTAKKVSNSMLATHHLSISQDDMEENGSNYLGKVKSSFTGAVNNIFGPGLSPDNARDIHGGQRELLATVVYITEMFSGGSKPREFRLFLKKPDVSYFSLTGVTIGQEEVSLQDLYPLNKERILVYRNRKPVWKEQINGYSLNFHGRVSQPSIKNFILEADDQEKQGNEVLLFGRISDDKFNMDVSGPLTLAVALGIVMTSFGSA